MEQVFGVANNLLRENRLTKEIQVRTYKVTLPPSLPPTLDLNNFHSTLQSKFRSLTPDTIFEN